MITRPQFDALASTTNDYSVSIYIPTYRVGQQQEDKLRLKNALKKAVEKLGFRYGLSEQEAKEFLAPALALEEQSDFWRNQSDGLALFIAEGRFEHYSCPIDFETMIYVAPEFYLRPLVPLLGNESAFYLLALSKGAVKMYAGTQYSIAEVDMQGLIPQNMDAALRLDKGNNNLDRAGGAEGQGGNPKSVFFSRGEEPGTDVQDVKVYLDRVDKGVSDYLCDDNAPLVLGGVESLIPIYEEANAYDHLYTKGHVAGNLENVALPMLHEKAWSVVAPHFREQAERDLKLYGDNLAAKEAGSDLETIVPAAINGRIAALWLDRNAYAYGRYHADTNDVEIMTDEDKNATELYNLAAVRALESGARVYNVDSDELPSGATGMAAIYRYTMDPSTTNQ